MKATQHWKNALYLSTDLVSLNTQRRMTCVDHVLPSPRAVVKSGVDTFPCLRILKLDRPVEVVTSL